jgi:hypothetical protein
LASSYSYDVKTNTTIILVVWWTNKCTNGQPFIILLLLQCRYVFWRYCATLREFVSSACQVT